MFPYVLYSDSNNYCNLVQYDGSMWVNVGPAAFSIQGVSGSSLQITSDGSIYVAYSDTSVNFNGNLSVVQLVNNTWTPVGITQFAQGQLQTHNALAVDTDGHIFVTYTNSNTVSVMANFGDGWCLM